MSEETEQPAPRPVGVGSLAESLLLEALNRLSVIERQNIKNEQQNVTILAGQARAEQSRSAMHQRIDEISVNVAGIDHRTRSLEKLEPIVNMLKDAHLERKTVHRVVNKFCKNGYVIGAGGIGLVGTVWHQWGSVRDGLLRILGIKIGGP